MLFNRNRFVAKSIWARTMSQAVKNKAAVSSSGAGPQLTQRPKVPSNNTDNIANLDSANVIPRVQKKLPEREPLVKNFFVSKVDKELLAFPEILEKEDLDKLKLSLQPVVDFFANRDKENPVLPLDDLKRFGLLNGTVPKEFGGQNQLSTETCLTAEAEGITPSDAIRINAHRLVIDAIAEHGTSEQQKKYLPKLASGEIIGTVCMFEANAKPQASTNTTAELNEHETEWILKGNLFYFFIAKS